MVVVAAALLALPASTTAAAPNPETVVGTASQALNAYWKTLYADYETAYVPPKAVKLFTRAPKVSGCRVTGDATYCRANKTVYVRRAFVARRSGQAFAVEAVLAHQWARFVQHDIGWFSFANKRRYYVGAELQADCYAGMYARHAARIGRLVTTDLPTASALMVRSGDPTVARDGRLDRSTEKRLEWFGYGYQWSNIDVCDSVYALLYG